jgi:hypothetical protein
VRSVPLNERATFLAGLTPKDRELFLALESIDPPPASSVGIPVTSQGRLFYLPGDGKVTLYGYSNYHWSRENPQGLTYWQREVTVEELSP